MRGSGHKPSLDMRERFYPQRFYLHRQWVKGPGVREASLFNPEPWTFEPLNHYCFFGSLSLSSEKSPR